MDLKRIVLLLPVISAILVAGISSGRAQSGNSSMMQPSTPAATAQTTTQQTKKAPTGASRCQFCHAAEVEGYARSAMAHSLRRADLEPDGTVTTPDANIVMHSSPAGYWQRLQSGGEVTDYRIDYVIGSGNHASGYLLDLASHLFQSPVAYYKSRQAYDLAPGYEGLPNPDFTRPVAEACLFCHAGTALHVPGTSNLYRSPPFPPSAEAITCERCHGSAQKHLSDPRAGTIVNPRKLERAARDSICEQCHLLGVGRVLNPGKKFSDFRPGQPLEDTFTTYVNALPPDADAGKFKVISHVEQLARSTCARKSNGQLWCGTCHDPHTQPLEPIQFYRAKCLTCHTGKFSDPHPAKDSNCIGCHMPRRDAKDGGHTAFTDHRIQRRPEAESALPEDVEIAAWREPTTDQQNADLQKRNLGIAYINAGGERRSPPFVIRGYRMLTEVQNQFASDSNVFTAMGTALLMGKKTSEAELAFERALQLSPDSVSSETNAASAYLQAGDSAQAMRHLEHAVALDPMHLAADAPLIELYKQQGDAARAAELSSMLNAAMEKQSTSDEIAERPEAFLQLAGAAYKNIQVLKDVSADQLIPAMRFITASLGVECAYCHVADHFERDDKKPKQTARDMMRMVLAIDKNTFASNREVTCYSCHRGSPKPQAMPSVAGLDMASEAQPKSTAPDPEKLIFTSPTAGELIDRYIQALGGAAAIEKISSRHETGTTTLAGKSIAVEIYQQDPNREALIRHLPGGESTIVFDGNEGWTSTPRRPVREMHGAELDAARMDADLHFPLHLRKAFDELRVEYPEKVGGRAVYVLLAETEGQGSGGPAAVRFYFDEQSGLLVRMIRYAQSPLGVIPTQIDYSDYRDAGGVQTPFRWTIAQPDSSSTIQLEQVQPNVPVDHARFAKLRSSEPGAGRSRP
jgi:photosynthetic reaction center cytochrome c subunit